MRLQIVSNRHLGILDVFLVQQAVLLVEFSHTSLGDVLNHLGRQVGSLLGSNLLFQVANLLSLCFSDVAFHNAFVQMLFVFSDVEVETGFLQSSLHSLLNLLGLRLFNCHLEFIVLHILGHTGFVHSNRVHGSYLHGNLMTNLIVNCLVQQYHCAKEVLVLVIIYGDSGTFYSLVAVQFHLFACDAATVGYSFSHRHIAQFERLHFVQRLTLVGHGSIQNILSKFYEISVLSHKVSFALQGNHCAETIYSLRQHTTFGSFTVRTLSSHGLSLLTDNFNCLVEIAFCLSQGVLTVHHTSTRHFAELGYISHCYSHIRLLLKGLLKK